MKSSRDRRRAGRAVLVARAEGTTGEPRCAHPDVVAGRRAAAIARRIALVGVGIDLAALTVHVIELPGKLALPGPLWLGIQQTLYRGWGAAFGPVELVVLASTWLLVAFTLYHRDPAWRTASVAALTSTAMLAVFFLLVEPTNRAVAGWTPGALPADWDAYRLRWELGHAMRAALALVTLATLLRMRLARPDPVSPPCPRLRLVSQRRAPRTA
jgi:hypothetical protein